MVLSNSQEKNMDRNVEYILEVARCGGITRAAVMGVLTASCVSIMTPIAAPCQIMIMEPGGYKLKDYVTYSHHLANT